MKLFFLIFLVISFVAVNADEFKGKVIGVSPAFTVEALTRSNSSGVINATFPQESNVTTMELLRLQGDYQFYAEKEKPADNKIRVEYLASNGKLCKRTETLTYTLKTYERGALSSAEEMIPSAVKLLFSADSQLMAKHFGKNAGNLEILCERVSSLEGKDLSGMNEEEYCKKIDPNKFETEECFSSSLNMNTPYLFSRYIEEGEYVELKNINDQRAEKIDDQQSDSDSGGPAPMKATKK